MLSFTGNLKVYLATQPCDMRKSFNGLSAVVAQKLAGDPLSKRSTEPHYSAPAGSD